ncbi:MAG: tyrosine--tRNA ligase [Candidatus Thermoplasmatota archaeon]|nr:tyrosine--tRNA ligase [Candidatus Thermoplasmatota archaeon]MEC7111517.1 tyrosine--tRNA ligase [Candidatus Thermoplasmatota archaeon]MEC7279295.1 tyrosine--tRNA ligase [Candidatus Thermoplasmatota archaeon]MEC7461635.1 tyrosine--tRNA ligase [Candidatus Thermoplasmatota archaeon]MEC8079145.1 tyrosine--tRNA ligase [Candidatus Thermoplasmatota archaeon]
MDLVDLDAMAEAHPGLADLDEAALERLKLMVNGAQEVVGLDHLISVLAGGPSMAGDDVIRCYVGFEPSGTAHIGWKVLALRLRRLLDARANVMVFLADWHAWVNDKFSGDMAAIQTTARYMEDTFRALLGHPEEGEGAGQLRFVWASTVMSDGDYWARVLRCSKGMTLAQVRKTFSIMGRDEASSDNDLSKFYYPAMQAADIGHMHIDLAIGGMDQRKAHMYMRDVSQRWGWRKATCLHTPIISGLNATGGRMETFDHKMSKSDPRGAILLHDDQAVMRKKMRKAYLDPADEHSPVYELAEHIVLPEQGVIHVTPNPKFGEPSAWDDLDAFRAAVADGTLHPLDAKWGVADGLAAGLSSVASHFEAEPDLLEAVRTLMGR